MEFTKEAWENAPEGARLEYGGWKSVTLIGYSINRRPVVEDSLGGVWACSNSVLRIVLPKRKVMVQLWQRHDGALYSTVDARGSENKHAHVLVGEYIFEIDGE